MRTTNDLRLSVRSLGLQGLDFGSAALCLSPPCVQLRVRQYGPGLLWERPCTHHHPLAPRTLRCRELGLRILAQNLGAWIPAKASSATLLNTKARRPSQAVACRVSDSRRLDTLWDGGNLRGGGRELRRSPPEFPCM